jgi:putative ABC transport system permease protein
VSNPIRQVALRNLGAHKVRLLLTVIAIVLGTAFIAGSLIFTDTLKSTFDKIVTTSTKGLDVQVQPRKDNNPGVPVDLVDKLKAVPGVRAVEPQANGPIVLVAANGKKVQSGGAPSIGAAWTPADEQITPAPTFISGQAPSAADDVVINDSAAKKGDIKTGDHVIVITAAHDPQTVTVSGIYHTDVETGGYIGVLYTQAEALKLFTDGSHVATVSIAGRADVSQATLRDRVAAILPADLKAETGKQVEQDTRDDVQKALSFINYFLLAFGAIALLVGTFIIYNTFSMIVAQRVRELALLRAIGASKGQVGRSVVFEAGVIGLIGSIIGIGGGVGLAYGLKAFLDAVGSGLPGGGLVLSPRTVIVALLVGILVTLFSAYSPARRASKTPPVAAMRAEFATTTNASLRRRNIIGLVLTVIGAIATVGGATSDSAGTAASLVGLGLLGVGAGVLMLSPMLSRWVIGAIGAVLGRPFGTVGRLARTNSVRNPRRTAATAFALTLGLLLVSAISVVGASTKASLDTIIDTNVRADFILTNNTFGLPIQAAAAAAKVPGVQSLTEIHSVRTTINGSNASGIAVDGPVAAVVKVDFVSGGGLPTDADMQFSQTTAKDKKLSVGQQVTLTTPGGASVTEKITGIYKDNPLLGNWMVSGDTYRTLTPSNEYLDEVGLVVAVPGTDLATLRAGLETATDPYYVVNVQDRQEFKGTQAEQVNGLLGVLYALLGLAIIIAVLGIINTLALSVVERRREIGMLRAVGMQRAQVRRTIYLVSAMIAIFGAVLGVVIGLVYGVLFTRTLKSQGLGTVSVPWGQAVLFVVIAGVVGVLAALWPGIRAARTRPLEAIVMG